MQGVCELCRRYGVVEKHHVFNGAYRKKSEHYGAVCYLCHNCHNEPPNGVHHNAKNMHRLKARYQLKIMRENHFTVDDFIKEFGKSYIDLSKWQKQLDDIYHDIPIVEKQLEQKERELKKASNTMLAMKDITTLKDELAELHYKAYMIECKGEE